MLKDVNVMPVTLLCNKCLGISEKLAYMKILKFIFKIFENTYTKKCYRENKIIQIRITYAGQEGIELEKLWKNVLSKGLAVMNSDVKLLWFARTWSQKDTDLCKGTQLNKC